MRNATSRAEQTHSNVVSVGNRVLLAAIGAVAYLWATPAVAGVCRYDVTPDASQGLAALALDVTVNCDRAVTATSFAFDYGAGRHAIWGDGPGLAYRIALGRVASAGARSDFAATQSGVLAPVAAWIAAPASNAGIERLEITLHPAEGVHPTLNLDIDVNGAFVLQHDDWRFSGYAAFAARPPLSAIAPGPAAFDQPGRNGPKTADIQIAVLADGLSLSDDGIIAWIERFAGFTARFWAGFPSDRLLIAIVGDGRLGDPFGRVRGGGGPTMMLRLANRETAEFLATKDWVLTHEMIHLGAPFAQGRPPWFMEGMATYLEGLIRALGGATPEQQVWDGWTRFMPTGAYGLNVAGLEGGGHPYWTGALFFLLAHTTYAEAGLSNGLTTCFRAIRADLGDAANRATVEMLIDACDRAVGLPVLANLKRNYSAPTAFDLSALWQKLGVERVASGSLLIESGSDLRRRMFGTTQFRAPTP